MHFARDAESGGITEVAVPQHHMRGWQIGECHRLAEIGAHTQPARRGLHPRIGTALAIGCRDARPDKGEHQGHADHDQRERRVLDRLGLVELAGGPQQEPGEQRRGSQRGRDPFAPHREALSTGARVGDDLPAKALPPALGGLARRTRRERSRGHDPVDRSVLDQVEHPSLVHVEPARRGAGLRLHPHQRGAVALRLELEQTASGEIEQRRRRGLGGHLEGTGKEVGHRRGLGTELLGRGALVGLDRTAGEEHPARDQPPQPRERDRGEKNGYERLDVRGGLRCEHEPGAQREGW